MPGDCCVVCGNSKAKTLASQCIGSLRMLRRSGVGVGHLTCPMTMWKRTILYVAGISRKASAKSLAHCTCSVIYWQSGIILA